MYKILSYLLICLLLPTLATAQTEVATKTNMIIKQASVMMARAPRGGKMGELYINSPVSVEKEEGEWVLVSLKTWIKKDGLGTSVAAVATPNTGKASDVLVIETFSTRIVEQGLPEKRVYLTLKLKNNSAAPIAAWKAILIAQEDSTVFFREPISDDTKVIPAGQSVELNFYWEPNEPPFKHLENSTPESFKLQLSQVVLER